MDEHDRTESARRVSHAYDRLAGVYDLCTAPMERFGGAQARARLFGRARGRVLEVGAGTGANFGHYPADVVVTALDISPRMTDRAVRRAAALGRPIECEVGDVEHLRHPDNSFDTVTAACTFCSVPDPVQGLREIRRVVRPTGQVLLYEHVRPPNPVLGRLADLVSPLSRRLFGPSVNRRTEQNIEAAGLEISEVRRRGIWREIVAHKAESPPA
jgi:ubiquinone/menaquinone biosynthesis C-methylase UbiE